MANVLWTAKEIQETLYSPCTSGWNATGISIDSRTLKAGDLFFALKGPLADGHHFIENAFAQGAVAAVVEHPREGLPSHFPQICVPDSLGALNQLAHAARTRAQGARVIGLTGSFGKTSTREALRHSLSGHHKIHTTERNFNNLWGVPLSVARMPAECRFAVFEIGTNHPGEIEPLSKIVHPHLCFITTIGDAHIGNFGSLDAIAQGKSEILAGAEPGGTAVLNLDNPQYKILETAAKERNLDIITFGRHESALCRLTGAEFAQNKLVIHTDIAGQRIIFSMAVPGEHWALNMVGVLACLHALGQDVRQGAHSLSTFTPLAGRGAIYDVAYQSGEFTLIDESYNAGPSAMQTAIRSLGRLTPGPQGRRVAVLSDMADLGKFMEKEHKALAPVLLENNIHQVFLYGPYMKYLEENLGTSIPVMHFQTLNDLVNALREYVQSGDCILVKGARGQRAYEGIMNQVVLALRSLGKE